MSIALILSRGFGNGSIDGTIKDLVTMGYGISEFIPPTVPIATGLVGNQSAGIGMNRNQSTGNGILGTQSTGSGFNGTGGL